MLREKERRGMEIIRLTFFLQLSNNGVLSSIHGPKKIDIQAMIRCFFQMLSQSYHSVPSITSHYYLGYQGISPKKKNFAM